MKKKSTFFKSVMFLFFLSSFTFMANAQTVTVMNSNDSGAGSFRQAVIDAAAGSTIVFDAAVNGNTIMLVSAVTIDKNLTISGNGEDQTMISGGDTTRIFSITDTENITVNNLTLTNGFAVDNGGAISSLNSMLTLNDVTITSSDAAGNNADQGGGAIYLMGGMLTANNSTFSNNTASGTSGSGGAILVGTGGNVTIVGSTITDNMASRAGGGIESNSGAMGTVTLTNVNLDANETGANPGNGGGLHITGAGNATISGGTVNNNVAAAEGGGLWNGSGTMTVTGTTISMNTASGNGADQGGGGIYNLSGMLEVNAGTVIMGNIANGTAGSGGGILNDVNGMLTVNGAEITGNTSNRAGGGIEYNSGAMGSVTLNNIMLNGNTTNNAPGNGGGLHVTGMGTVTISGGMVNDNTAGAEGGGLWNGTGTMNIDGTVISGNTASGAGADQGGGGIYNLNGGTLTIMNATISNNVADGAAGSGGGILNDVGSMLTVTDTEISGNTAMRAGGGIEDNSGTSTIMLTNVILNGNITSAAPGNGGGLHITGSGSAVISGGSVTNNTAALQGGGLWNGTGTMTVSNVMIDGNTASGASAADGGGGIFNTNGTLIVENSTITNNIANGTSGNGGGIFSAAGDVTIVNTDIMNNSANRAGGAIEIIAGTLTVNDSELSGNDVDGGAGTPNPGNGGALHVSGAATIVFNGGMVNNNMAAREGGGLWNQTGSVMTVNNVTLDSNTAAGGASDDGGGAIFNNGGTLNVNGSTLSNNAATGLLGRGGGIHVNAGTANVMLTTISGNTALTNGGGIFNNAELNVNANTITLNSATISGGGISNSSAMSPMIKNSIIAGNIAVVSGADVFSDEGMISSNGYNLIGLDGSDAFDANEDDMVGTVGSPIDAGLLALADNGGPTFTHMLNCPSVAADMGDPNDNFDDQTGASVFNGRRDIGAYEAQEPCVLANENFTAGNIESVIYPNPSVNGFFNIELAANHTAGADVLIYEIGTGKLVKQMKAENMSIAISMNGYASGTYILQIISDKATETHKVVITN
ncbi:T9SS type A sorting domain-containing protein [Flavobacterium sp. LaA7.5]|nr:T9SS type A sorting domain-containing protein [Flavobacterium salilacus subsp. altitudinum]